MIYQIEYIREDTWNVTCPVCINMYTLNFILKHINTFKNIIFKDLALNISKDYNTANWVGFKKSTTSISLLNLLKGYICK